MNNVTGLDLKDGISQFSNEKKWFKTNKGGGAISSKVFCQNFLRRYGDKNKSYCSKNEKPRRRSK
jgi:hypothetical protein